MKTVWALLLAMICIALVAAPTYAGNVPAGTSAVQSPSINPASYQQEDTADEQIQQEQDDAGGPSGEKSFNLDNASAQEIGAILVIFLVLSIVFEIALTPLFNWSVFIRRFEGRGLKTPIIIILAFLVFWSYGLDIIKDLLNAMGAQDTITLAPVEKTLGGQILTALLIAGGSAGFYEIFKKLGIRNRDERVQEVFDRESQAPPAQEEGATATGTAGTVASPTIDQPATS